MLLLKMDQDNVPRKSTGGRYCFGWIDINHQNIDAAAQIDMERHEEEEDTDSSDSKSKYIFKSLTFGPTTFTCMP